MAEFRINEAEVRAFLLGEEIADLMNELGRQAASVARRTVRVRTGATKASIALELHRGPEYQAADVSASQATLFLEKGVGPHVIERHPPGESLARDRIEFFGPIVHHPGMHRYPFLTTGLWSLQDSF